MRYFRSVECSIKCMKTLLKILRYHTVYKDVFREVGLLEVMVTCLHRYAAMLKELQSNEREILFIVQFSPPLRLG